MKSKFVSDIVLLHRHTVFFIYYISGKIHTYGQDFRFTYNIKYKGEQDICYTV